MQLQTGLTVQTKHSTACLAPTFACLTLEQALCDELGAAGMQLGSLVHCGRDQALVLVGLPAGQLGGEECQSGEQQPRVVVDVGLDEAVAVTDADGHHRVDSDSVSGEVTGRERARESIYQALSWRSTANRHTPAWPCLPCNSARLSFPLGLIPLG